MTGKPKWWDVMVTPIRDAEGRPEHLLSISREITEQKQAEEEIAQRARLAELRADINAALSDAGPLSTLLQQCAERFVERLDMAFARIWTLNEAEDVLELQASAGLYTHLNGPHGRVKMGELKIGRIAQSGIPLLANDMINDPNTADREWAAREGISAFAGYPLIVAGRILGVAGMFARHAIPETVLNELKPCCDAIAQCIQRKWAEEAVHQRTAQFETLLNEAPLGVYLIDADLRIREVNPTARAVFGNMPGLIGRDFGEVLHILWPDAYADEVIPRFRHTLTTGEPYIVPEWTEERLDRRVREYYEWRINRIPLPEGRFGVVCYFQDISRQVLARKIIAESEERLRFMAESMPQKIFTATPNGDVDYFNRQWMEFTGLSFDQIKSWGWTQFIHPDDLEENLRLWRRSIATGELFQYMHRFRRFDGVYRWHLSRAHAMRDAGGNITMWIGSNTEIHDQKRIEEELRLRNEDLNQFAYAASHDLREPLRNVANYTELLVRTRGDDPGGSAEIFKKYIVEGVARMEALLGDLLAYTQVANAEPDASVDGGAVLEKALQNLAAGIAESGAVITRDVLPPLFGQESHYVQLFQNLIGNAIKYRGEQTPRVHVGVTEKGGDWLFSVRDNGIGIERQYAQKIFGLFKRLHGKDIPGTGIGLAICSRVVERYGGRIWVESEPGQGAVFFFTLPAGPRASGPRL
jgi:PAS domain S-box-containing protein